MAGGYDKGANLVHYRTRLLSQMRQRHELSQSGSQHKVRSKRPPGLHGCTGVGAPECDRGYVGELAKECGFFGSSCGLLDHVSTERGQETYTFRAPSSILSGVMSSSPSCFGKSDISSPLGRSCSLPEGFQNKLPGLDAPPLVTAEL